MIVNQSMARRFWPGEEAVGKRISFNDPTKESDWMKVIGVVGDVKDLKSKRPQPIHQPDIG